MKAKIIYIAMASLCAASFTGTAQADDYYSSQSPNSGSLEQHRQYRNEHKESHNEHKKDRNKFSFSINLPVQQEAVFVTERRGHHQYREPQWLGMRTGAPIPFGAVIGGEQRMPSATLFVCRASYHGGLHPGKLLNGRCNIGWGGNEISLIQYEVLVSRSPLRWVASSFGNIPPGAIQGGYQHDGPLFICQANYNGGRHPGKIVGQNCNFGWHGREIFVPYYNVLVR